MMHITNIEPLHHEQGAYRNWRLHWRNKWIRDWKYWMDGKQLASSGNSNRPRKVKRNEQRQTHQNTTR